MARTAIPFAFEMPEYTGRVAQHLIEAARSNSNLSGLTNNDSPFLAKDLQATADYLMSNGEATQAFFLLDELKRIG